jgi:hypothetical protein
MDNPFQIVRAPAAAERPSGTRWRRWRRQLGWMVLIWALSVCALALCAGLMRLFMHAMGMR